MKNTKRTGVDTNDLIFIDETGTHLNMSRDVGWAKKGYPAHEFKPTSTSKNTIAAISEEGFQSQFHFQKSFDTEMLFLTKLLPILTVKILVMDNHAVHHSKIARDFMDKQGIKYIRLVTNLCTYISCLITDLV